MNPSSPGAAYRLADLLRLSAASAPPEPPIALPVAKQRALREAFKAAGVSDDVAERFLRLISEHLETVEQLAGEYQADRAAFKALRADARSKRHLRDAKRSLDAALEHLAATKHLPTHVAGDLHAEDEAIQRIRIQLDVLSRWLARPQKRGPAPDLYQSMALAAIAIYFSKLGLRRVTTPAGLFATVGRILLKAGDDEIHPRDLLKAIKAAKR